MNVMITERDKKLLGFLAAFLIVLAFLMLVFRPLAQKNGELAEEIKTAREQEADFDDKASGALDMADQEEATRQKLGNVLSRFYPMQQSQDAERKVTTLMLNHGLEIQSLTITMPETASVLKWYQYSENGKAAGEIPASQKEGGEASLALYGARVVCVAEGNEQDMWELIDDISDNFPAISIISVEWDTSETIDTLQQAQETAPADFETDVEEAEHNGEEAENSQEEAEEEADEQEESAPWQLSEAETVRTDRLTIGLEIFMCNQ